MSNIEVMEDCGVVELIWEKVANHAKSDKVVASIISVATAFAEEGTEPDWQRAYGRARKTVRGMVSAQKAVWVADSEGRNTCYRILSFKERSASHALKVKHAGVKIPDEVFEKA